MVVVGKGAVRGWSSSAAGGRLLFRAAAQAGWCQATTARFECAKQQPPGASAHFFRHSLSGRMALTLAGRSS
jgi:hypothetical protein